MNNIATTIKQSKKLLELGLSPESADMCYLSEESLVPKVIYNGMAFFDSKEERLTNTIPCWSLGALLELMPKKIKKDDVKLPFHLFQFKDTWGVQYGYPNETEYAVLIENKTPLEAAYNMVVWLLENNYIKKEGNT